MIINFRHIYNPSSVSIVVGFIVNCNCSPGILGGIENMKEEWRAVIRKHEKLVVNNYLEVSEGMFVMDIDIGKVLVIFLDHITVWVEGDVFENISISDERWFV